MRELSLVIQNHTGLHARPAKVLSKLAKKYASDISIRHGEQTANAKSMISILKLGVKASGEISLLIDGIDEAEASAALREAIQTGLGEAIHPENGHASKTGNGHAQPEIRQSAPAPAVTGVAEPPGKGKMKGLAASPGIAIAPLHFLERETVAIDAPFLGAKEELAQLASARLKAQTSLQKMVEKMQGRGATEESDIFNAHLEILQDPDFNAQIEAEIGKAHPAVYAVQTAAERIATELAQLDDEILAARAADMRDVGHRLVRALSGADDVESEADNRFSEPVIVAGRDLTPSDTANLDPQQVLGIITAEGGPTAHSAIIARALGIPAVVGLGESLFDLKRDQMVIVDGGAGTLNHGPTESDLAAAREAITQAAAAAAKARDAADRPATTRDGHTVEIGGNAGGAEQTAAAFASGADGIGLLRTEFLFLDQQTAPDQAEQTETYTQIVKAMQGRPVIFRTLDIGGDKPVPYIEVPPEANPFLGERGVRLQLNRPTLLRTQLRALFTAGQHGPIRIMFPMVGRLDEWRQVRQIVEEVRVELNANPVEVGIMIEIPSAAVMARPFAAEVDFFSIGTNDLTQYTLAIDRQHPTLTAQADGLDPAVLRLIKMTVEGAKAHGKWVGVCGELGSDPQAVPILIGLGVDELSVSITAVARVKAQVRQLSYSACQALATRALDSTTAAEVRQLGRD